VWPKAVLIAAQPFAGRLDRAQTTQAVARGIETVSPLQAVGLAPEAGVRQLRTQLDTVRAVVVCDPLLLSTLDPADPSVALAQEARQRGVAAYGITAHPGFSRFDARVLDLQEVLVVGGAGARQLTAAGRRIGLLVADGLDL